MKRPSFVLILIIAFALTGLTSCGKFKARMEVKDGNDLYKARKYEEAIAKYRDALKKAPDIYQIYLNIGLSYMGLYVPGSTHPKDKMYADEAIKAFREYLKYMPDDENVNGYLVQMYLSADRKDDAIQYFEEHLLKNPADIANMQKLAFLYAQSGKFDQALKWYRTRAAVEPTNPEAYYIIGVICWEKSYKFSDLSSDERARVVQTGMDALDKAIALNPNYADAYLYMNLLYREKAKEISMDPNNVPQDRVDEYNGYLSKAKELLDRAMEIRKKANPT